MDNREIEVKFYAVNLAKIEERLHLQGAFLLRPRTYEINLRFDTREGDLQQKGRVLRLRRDHGIKLTYKDGGVMTDGAISRREIEISVNNFENAQKFVEALGYEVAFTYEKYRTTYQYPAQPTHAPGGSDDPETYIMLDELPYGNFVEIEGDPRYLKPIAKELGLRWEAAIPASYHTLFDQLIIRRKWEIHNLTFGNFKELHVEPSDLGIIAADT